MLILKLFLIDCNRNVKIFIFYEIGLRWLVILNGKDLIFIINIIRCFFYFDSEIWIDRGLNVAERLLKEENKMG